MKRIVVAALAAFALFAGTTGGSPAHAGPGHKVDIVDCQTTGCEEVNPAPGDITVDGWTWGA